ncbi:MAG TPA: choice-of-anchor tandem repeat NxxGxxAF-containing protein [Jiangellaceae bacterium]
MQRRRGNAVRAATTATITLALVLGPAGAAEAQEYTFVEVADSVADGFDPNNFGCAAINARGDVAFRTGRLADDGFNTVDGIYRIDARTGQLTTIAENERRFTFIGVNPSLNDSGQVSFAASLERGGEAIFRGRGDGLTTIATTRNAPFNFFGFDTSINNAGVVAFKAELDEEFGFDEGLFSGRGGRATTHYLASTSQFAGVDSRPSINNLGAIAFQETLDADFTNGVFVTAGASFTTIALADPESSVGVPVLNDQGVVAFETSFVDEATQEFVTAIVTGTGGPLTTVADTTGPFAFFGFRPPSLNSSGDVAFLATLDDASTTGIFTGPDADTDRVIATGDVLAGAIVQNLVFCEEGLSDTGQLAFVATLEDPTTPEGFRVAVFRAVPS